MALINSLLRFCFDALLYPFRDLPALVSLCMISLLVAIGVLLVFKAASNQEKLAAVKRRIHASVFEIRLFNDDLRAILRAQADLLRSNLVYLRLSLVPMLWTIAPLVLLVAQLQFHYAYRGLEPGQTTLVKVLLSDEWQGSAARQGSPDNAPGAATPKPEVVLEAPPGIQVETPPVWIASRNELAWRIAAERPGAYVLRLRLGSWVETKEVQVSDAIVRRSPVRVAPTILAQLIYPAEPPLSRSSPFHSIEVLYPAREIEIFGWGLHWLVVFFALPILFAFALRRLLKVTI